MILLDYEFPSAPKGYGPVEAYEELKQKNTQLEQTIALLVARIEDLEGRLSLNSKLIIIKHRAYQLRCIHEQR